MGVFFRNPSPRLAEYIDRLWYYVDLYPPHQREHVLPDGTFELMINLQGGPRKLFDRGSQTQYQTFKRGWISGAQSRYLVIDALPASSMIGVHFKPGGAAPFLGMPAGEFGNQVVELDAVWAGRIWDWRDQLMAAPGAGEKFDVLEALLLRRLAKPAPWRGKQKSVDRALSRFETESHASNIRSTCAEIGVSHKHFIKLFRDEVGLSPKVFCRVKRFQEVLRRIQSQRQVEWADVVFSCGYFDQAHFIKDFVEFSGLNPSAYIRHRYDEDPRFIRAAN